MLFSKPIRSALFVPGTRLDRVPKALATDADVVIIDLEDAVSPKLKDKARSEVVQLLMTTKHENLVVRVNGTETKYFDADISAIVGTGVLLVIVPKVETALDIELINTALLKAEDSRKIDRGSTPVIALIESAAGVENISEITKAETIPSRLYTVAFGAADYTLDMGIEMTPDGTELLYARSRLPIACKAAGLAPPLDTPFMLDLKDLDALQKDVSAAKQLGFQGKLCIHPNQVAIVNQTFSPTPEKIEWAKKIVEAFEEAESAGQSALQIDGKFVDTPVVMQARRILKLSSA